MTDSKRECDNSRYKLLPCANQNEPLDEYFDTMTHMQRWGTLCRECTMAHGFINSKVTTHMKWDGVAGCYLKQKRRRRNGNGLET